MSLKYIKFLLFLTYFSAIQNVGKTDYLKDDLGDRIKVRAISDEELHGSLGGYGGSYDDYGPYEGYGHPADYGGHGGHGGYHPEPYPPVVYPGHVPTHRGKKPHYKVKVKKEKSHSEEREKKLGMWQKFFQKGMDKITEKLLGVAEPVEYERVLYQEPPAPRYVEVKVPKCKDQLEVPIYITETLLKTKKDYITKYVTKTKKIKEKEYIVNTKTRTKTKTVTSQVPQYVPAQTVYKTVTATYLQKEPVVTYIPPTTPKYEDIIVQSKYKEPNPQKGFNFDFNKGKEFDLHNLFEDYKHILKGHTVSYHKSDDVTKLEPSSGILDDLPYGIEEHRPLGQDLTLSQFQTPFLASHEGSYSFKKKRDTNN